VVGRRTQDQARTSSGFPQQPRRQAQRDHQRPYQRPHLRAQPRRLRQVRPKSPFRWRMRLPRRAPRVLSSREKSETSQERVGILVDLPWSTPDPLPLPRREGTAAKEGSGLPFPPPRFARFLPEPATDAKSVVRRDLWRFTIRNESAGAAVTTWRTWRPFAKLAIAASTSTNSQPDQDGAAPEPQPETTRAIAPSRWS
jgi:hypothetical protein